MQTIKRAVVSLAFIVVILAFIGHTPALRGQSDAPPVADTILQPVAPDDIPPGAAFFNLSDYLNNGGRLGGPYPFLKDTNAVVYSLNANNRTLLADDTSMTNDSDALNALALLLEPQDAYSASVLNGTNTSSGAMAAGGTMMAMDSADINPGDASTNSSGGDTGSYSPGYVDSFPTNGLWIYVPTNSLAESNEYGVILENTITNEEYDVLTSTNLALPLEQWTIEQSVLGAEGTNCTPVALLMNGRSNLFVTARFGGSSDGSGLPDWWEDQYFGTNGIDPYTQDSSGDGWNLLDDFQNGFVPGQWNTPPPPQNFSVQLESTGPNAVLTWQSGGGAVDHYELDASDGIDPPFDIGEVSPQTFTFTFNLGSLSSLYYRAVAVFANGTRSATAWEKTTLDRDATVFRGPGGQFYLAVPNIPQNLSAIYLTWDFSSSEYVDASNIVNGIVQFPQGDQLNIPQDAEALQVQLVVGTNYGDYIYPTYSMYPEHQLGIATPVTNFANASAQMKENLRFLFRSAGVLWPFGYSSGLSQDANTPESHWARGRATTNYEYYGFHTFSPNLSFSFMDELRPVYENFLWRNFVYNPIDYSDGFLDTGLGWQNEPDGTVFPELNNPKYQYTGSGTESNLPLAFNLSTAGWLFCPPVVYGTDTNVNYTNLGIYQNATGPPATYVLGENVTNIYGLVLQSAYANTNFVPLGSTLPDPDDEQDLFENYAAPDLQIVDYFFGSQTPFFNYVAFYTNVVPYTSLPPFSAPPPLIPGSPSFSTTTTSPLLITGIGQPITVSGWAKMTVSGANTNAFGYLEQYFDFGQAFAIGTNGLASTNSVGLLSPYGDFFPTMPGPAALITMPDIDTGQRGTSVVNVIKLQLDVNHDGTMDLSFGGPDNTSQAHPFEFWVNNDCDVPGYNGGLDYDVYAPNSPDYAYSDSISGGGKPCIHSQRDLEDYARLWVCGIPPSLDASYQVTLSWGSISSGNPVINLFQSVESDGGYAYLTNTILAAAQALATTYDGSSAPLPGPGRSIGTVSNGAPFTFPAGYFATNSAAYFATNGSPYFLFEGAGIGSGQLTLTISQGTNILAQTSQWLDLHDVKDFYERTVITNNTSGAISIWSSAIETNRPASASVLGDDTNIIVLIHGINVSMENWWIEGDTVLKRLYWSGFRGKFAAVKWPCNFFDWSLLKTQTSVFNQSEVKGYKASPSLAGYLSGLRARYPGYGLHLLAHSQGNAITGDGIEQLLGPQGLPFDTYILTQGALPASCYDPDTIPTNVLVNAENGYETPQGQPEGYVGMYTNFPGRIVNFYNPLDPVLAIWTVDQSLGKPDSYIQHLTAPCHYYTYDSPFGYYNFGNNLVSEQLYRVDDMEESRAMIARSLTWPIGQYGAQSPQSVIGPEVNLHVQFNFANSSFDDHSAQWAWPIQITRPYFQQVLTSCKIAPAP